jgi:uncharacterized membrane protein YoaK (UPF0700 family)
VYQRSRALFLKNADLAGREESMADVTTSEPGFNRKDLTLALLAFASSSTDVLSFLALSGVFTSAMTGNTALLGLALGQGQMLAASRSLAALLGFMAGVAVGTLMRGAGDRRRPLAWLLGLESMCLGLFALGWSTLDHPAGTGADYALIVLSALGMGMQSVAARTLNVPGITTVVFTSTLTGIVMTAVEAVIRRVALPFDAIRQLAVFSVYLLGAVLAGWLASRHIDILVGLPLLAVLGALALQFRRAPQKERTS